MIRQLAHLCLKSNQIDALLVFYRDVLGLPVQFTLDDPDGKPFGYYFALGGTSFLEIFDQAGAARQWGGPSQTLRHAEDGFYQHFCLQVDQLDAFRATLIARGVAVTEITTGMDHARQCWIHDPDHNSIELMEYTAHSLQLRRDSSLPADNNVGIII